MIAWIVLLVLLVGCLLLTAAAMRRGWRNRARRQALSLPQPPAPPEGAELREPLLSPMRGLYVGTVFAGNWQDWVAVGDLGCQATATSSLTTDGLLVERTGQAPLWIERDSLVDARTDRALAGKVIGKGSLFVLRWRHGGRLLDTGIRGDDRAAYDRWITAVDGLVAGAAEEGERR